MYKIVSIVDLNIASKFIKTDKLIEISEDFTKMDVGENDYAHKNQTYLTSCINIADNAYNSYLDAIDYLESTYLTNDISSVYMPENSLIKTETFDDIMNSDFYLTKDACKALEANCISYIDELKNKAISIIMGKLNYSFISQNSVGRKAYGQVKKVSENSYESLEYETDILHEEDFTASADDQDFDFNGTGEFSLGRLLYDADVESPIEDYWWYYDSVTSSFVLPDNKSYSNITRWLNSIEETYLAFSMTDKSKDNLNVCISVPSASYDYKKKEPIPVARFVEFFLKRQIKTAIKKVCDRYMSKMTSIPR